MDIDLSKINDSDHILDVLIQCENILDSLDMYCYKHWLDGEIVEGPVVRRYWVNFSVRYAYYKMPDPRAALRLLKHGVQVEFDRVKSIEAALDEDDDTPDDWLVHLSFPRRLLDTQDEAELEVYDDDVNSDDVESAQDTGLDSESALHADEQLPDGNSPEMPMVDPNMEKRNAPAR